MLGEVERLRKKVVLEVQLEYRTEKCSLYIPVDVSELSTRFWFADTSSNPLSFSSMDTDFRSCGMDRNLGDCCPTTNASHSQRTCAEAVHPCSSRWTMVGIRSVWVKSC